MYCPSFTSKHRGKLHVHVVTHKSNSVITGTVLLEVTACELHHEGTYQNPFMSKYRGKLHVHVCAVDYVSEIVLPL